MNSWRQIVIAAKFFSVGANICESSVGNLLISLLWSPEFWGGLYRYLENVYIHKHTNTHTHTHTHTHTPKTHSCVISGFRRGSDDTCVLLDYYETSSGNFLPMFRVNPSLPSFGVKNPQDLLDSWPLKMEPIGCPETSVRIYNYPPPNYSEECTLMYENRL